MNRKETTKFLTEVLIQHKLIDRKYYAKEVTLDYGTNHPKRIDVVQYSPKGVIFASDMEKGVFTCYEIKSCKEDIYSGHGLNFFGEKNYIITTMDTYKKIQDDLRNGVLNRYIKENYPESSSYFGFLIPVPSHIDLRVTDQTYAEFENPTELSGNPYDWQLWSAMPCREGPRKRSTTEMLFCMLRAKHSFTNIKDETP